MYSQVELGETARGPITVLLSRVNDGDRRALDDLIPLVYQELHRIADVFLRRESRNHTLQSTALIHEAYLRLADSNSTSYRDRGHFFAIAATVMRRILVDHARARHAAKRDSRAVVALTPDKDVAREQDKIVIALDDALTTLAEKDADAACLVEMRFFGGLSVEEIAECVGKPAWTVRRALRASQIWLRQEMER